MKIEVDLGDLMDQLDEIGAGLTNEAVRPAAQAGAQVFYDTVRAKAPMAREPHKSGWKAKGWEPTLFEPGSLKNAVYQVFSEKQSSEAFATYEISVNHKKAPYWLFVEFGQKKKSARPFLRPAYYAAEKEAQQAAVQTYIAKAREVIQGAGRTRGKRRGT